MFAPASCCFLITYIESRVELLHVLVCCFRQERAFEGEQVQEQEQEQEQVRLFVVAGSLLCR